jgi:hypothetical protein
MGAVLRFRSSPKIAQSRRPAASGPAAAQLQAVCTSVGARPNPEDDAARRREEGIVLAPRRQEGWRRLSSRGAGLGAGRYVDPVRKNA